MKKLFSKGILTVILILALMLAATSCGVSDSDDGGVNDDGIGGGFDVSTDVTVLGEEEGNVSYVLIYNPKIYDENIMFDSTTLNTGDFSMQIDTDSFRGDGITDEPKYVSRSQKELNELMPDIEFEPSRGDIIHTAYKKGDTKKFYAGGEQPRTLTDFYCKYVGEHCYIWTVAYGGITDAQAEDYGKEFDENIYNQVTETFGQGRFTDNGGKVNLLFYPMEESLGGFFWALDLYAADEVTDYEIQQYGINTNHAIININSDMANNPNYRTFQYSTMAHEYQHLICFTNTFSTVNGVMMRTWLNEAMSGYIEEKLYSGAQEEAGRFEAFATSDLIRHGQSMYNFTTNTGMFNFDIGVYGSVYLFSEYLADVSGDSVFSNIHKYWRTSYSTTLDEAEAIAKSVSSSTYDAIDEFISFPDRIGFADENDEWMSKLTLRFYLSLLKYDSSDPKAYKNVKAQTLLYDEINPADIEGGGRVILATVNGTYEIPEDAEEGLIYVGLDENFNIVTEFVYK